MEFYYLCLYMASSEAVDVCGQFGNIMKVNLAQLIAVESPQLEC